MDEHNVHHFWGNSPFMDLIAAYEALTKADTSSPAPSTSARAQQEPSLPSQFRCLQVCSYDARHTLATLCRASRHPSVSSLVLHVYEEEPEVLARHMLLLHVLLDGSLTARDRIETLLELHGNALLRDKTAAYLDAASRVLEEAVTAQQQGQQQQGLARLFDLSQLRFQERDALTEAFQKYRLKVQYDMVKAWETRCTRWYDDRYDSRRNLIDWDYHMRLAGRGTPGLDPSLGAITHFYHFRHWRLHGIAHELRDASYSAPNRSLLSTAIGRTKEFKDRKGQDVGRGVSAWGFWGDILNGPFQAFGVTTEDERLLKVVNKQFAHTAVDVAEHNIQAFLHELRTGQCWADSSNAQGEAHRAPAARGPTNAENLQQQQQQEQQQQQQQEQEQQQQEQEQQQQAGDAEHVAIEEVHEQQAQASSSTSSGNGHGSATANRASSSNSSNDGKPHSGHSVPLQEAPTAGPSSSNTEAAMQALHISSQNGGSNASTGAGQLDAAACGNGTAGSIAHGNGSTPGSDAVTDTSSTDAMKQQEAALRAAEAGLDAAAWGRLANARVVLLCGDASRAFGGQKGKKLAGSFHMATLGARHVHLAGAGHGLAQLLCPGGLLLVESGKYMVQLSSEQLEGFGSKVGELAAAGGFEKADAVEGAAAPDGYLVFRAQDAPRSAGS